MTWPQYRQSIRDFVSGDSLRIERTVLDLPTGLIVTKAWFTVKATASDLDAAAVLLLTITTSSTSSGQILDDGTLTGQCQVRFTLLPAQTLLLAPGKVYAFDVQILLSDTGLYTPCKGVIESLQPVTIATS